MLTSSNEIPLDKSLLERIDFYRLDANRKLDPQKRSAMGQFMTPAPVALFMASLFQNLGGEIKLLDAGAGVGSLTAACIKEICHNKRRPTNIISTLYEIEPNFIEYLESTLKECRQECEKSGINFYGEILQEDFISASVNLLKRDLFSLLLEQKNFSHAILNPPYKKISSDSEYRELLSSVGIETSNLYTGFLSLAFMMLEEGGELVAIVPRSFCNGPYFKHFRKLFLEKMILKHIHVFESRSELFKDNDVLQENIIFHAIKGCSKEKVLISSSNDIGFEDITEREVNYEKVVDPKDPDLIIRVVTNELDQHIIDRVSCFKHTLKDIDIEVSTGPVVDFRLKDSIKDTPHTNTVPLIYPAHFEQNIIVWPKFESRKPNAIENTKQTQKWLFPNGYYTATRRFSSKEEKRRIIAAIHDPTKIPGEKIGFENHLNIFHFHRRGLPSELAKGLAVYLNSTLVDVYFRQFNGHTQVNVTDLKILPYPSCKVLEELGSHVDQDFPNQEQIDELLERTISQMTDIKTPDPIKAKRKIDEALQILKDLGLPRAQQNERSALTLLAILGLKPGTSWSKSQSPLIGITPIMDFCRDYYGKNYAPNTRETIRRQTMHQFIEAGLAIQNPDQPDRPINSPKWCYQIEPEALKYLQLIRLRIGKSF